MNTNIELGSEQNSPDICKLRLNCGLKSLPLFSYLIANIPEIYPLAVDT